MIKNEIIPTSSFYKAHSDVFCDFTIQCAMKSLGLNDSHTTKGLQQFKKEARIKFREKVKQLHPDRNEYHKTSKECGQRQRCNGAGLKVIIRHYNIIRRLKVMPITPQNAITVLKITKGYQTTGDIDIPTQCIFEGHF